MEFYKKSIVKKICLYFLCAFLMSSSFFMSYNNTLYVSAINTDYSEWEAAESICGVALALIGIVGAISTGGGLPALAAVAGGVFATVDGMDGLKDMIFDNGDGTFTITPEFVQLCIDEAIRQENSYFSDYESIQNVDGKYNISGYMGYLGSLHGYDSTWMDYFYSDTAVIKPFIAYNGVSSYCSYIWNNGSYSYKNVSYDQYADGKFYRHYSAYTIASSYMFSFNIPVFESIEAALAAFETGDFSGALNYREKMFEYGSIYAPVYNGGSVTFRKEVLEGLEDKLKEIDEKYDDVDDKINAINEYITNDGSGGSGGNDDSGGSDESGGSSGSGNSNYDGYFNDILDYLKKIYSSLKEIIEEIRDFDLSNHGGQDYNDVVESMNRLNDSLQELYARMDDDTSGQEIKDLLQKILEELKTQEGQDFEGVVDSMDSIDDKLQELLDLIGDDMSKDDIEDILQQILDALNNDGLIDGMENIEDKLQELLDSINDNMSKDDIEDILQQILKELRDQERQDLDGVIDGMESIGDKLQELLDSINDKMSKDDIEDILQQILEEMRNQEGQDLSGVTDRLDSLEETLNEILKELKNSGNDDGLLGDLINLLAKILDDPETGSQEMVDALSSSFGELVSGLTKKFPFSIPWDIQYMLLCLAETPRAPRFELPIVLERYGINENIIIEMEMFETLSELSRSLFSILFGIFLVNLTFKVIEMKKEE